MRGIGLEEIILVRILKHTGESYIVSSRRCTRLFLQIGMEFPSGRGDFLVEMCIFRPCQRGSKVGGDEIIYHM